VDVPRFDLQSTLRLSESGTAMLLGDLEQALMEATWKIKRPATARELHEAIAKRRDTELITAVTVLNRLANQKKLMRREKKGDLFHYEATMTRDEFMARASRHVAERVLGLSREGVATSMVDVLAERDPEFLAELARRVRRHLRDSSREK
jgi:predicted transcriptional regulator